MNAAAAKLELRLQARRRLAGIPAAARAAAGRAVADLAARVPEIAGARTLLCFAALPDEVPTSGVARAARRLGIELAYPRVDGDRLVIHRISGPGELLPGRWGIPEPPRAAPTLPSDLIDAVLVPGLAWDRLGRRLGRGGGFYDRLLADIPRAFRCGVLFAELEVETVPTDAWDLPFDAVLTPRELWRPRGSGDPPRNAASFRPPPPPVRTSSR